ncbi:MAG: orotidine 5'-phosphate decarboxylase / HUMPS family protein [Faecousia sp.]
MSIDILQTKMKKLNNTLMVNLSIEPEMLPAEVLEAHEDLCDAYAEYCCQLLAGLKGEAAAVRFSLMHFVLLGDNGISVLSNLMKRAASLGFYTLLDAYGISSPASAKHSADRIWGEGSKLPCDGILVSGYFGTDIIKPFLPYCENQKKDLFVVVRSTHKSSSEIQDLLAGSRTVHMAAADYVNRFGTNTVGKYGYSRIGIAASATAGDSVKMLRAKYPQLFMIIDGLDVSGANAKNASYGFNNLGHGAIVCVGSSITCAWKEEEYRGMDFVQAAVAAARKTQKKIGRYISVL